MKIILIFFLLTLNNESFSARECLYSEEEICINISKESRKFTQRVFRLITRNLSTLYNYPYSTAPPIINNKNFYVQEEVDLWAPITKSAHAFAHQLNMDNNWFNNFLYPWDEESKADYVAGFILNKMGASLKESHRSLIYIFSIKSICDFQDRKILMTPNSVKTNQKRKRLHFLTAGYLRALYGF